MFELFIIKGCLAYRLGVDSLLRAFSLLFLLGANPLPFEKGIPFCVNRQSVSCCAKIKYTVCVDSIIQFCPGLHSFILQSSELSHYSSKVIRVHKSAKLIDCFQSDLLIISSALPYSIELDLTILQLGESFFLVNFKKNNFPHSFWCQETTGFRIHEEIQQDLVERDNITIL